MKLTSNCPVAQPLRLATLVILSAVLVSCSARSRDSSIPPTTDPEATVRSFLAAVQANSLVGMGQLWGTANGPASDNLDRATLEQRLTVIRIYLEHEEFTIVPGDPAAGVDVDAGEMAVFVKLSRRGCTPTVPFTLVPHSGRWLVRDIDLAAAGNPSRRCGRE
jgi:hypothetical protein